MGGTVGDRPRRRWGKVCCRRPKIGRDGRATQRRLACSCRAGQPTAASLDRRVAVRKPLRRRKSGLFRRWHHGNRTTDLSRLRGSFVIARNTAFTFKGKNVDVREIGKELGVRYVLEGSVQRDQSQVRVNAQLIDAESGAHLWADRFDGRLAGLFQLQDQIVASLGSQLGAELIADEAQRGRRASNPDSMDLYFQGRALFNKGLNCENMVQARSFFERALELDPDNFSALLGSVNVDMIFAGTFMTDDRAARYAAIEATLIKVLSQAPNDASAHSLMCRLLLRTNRVLKELPNASEPWRSIRIWPPITRRLVLLAWSTVTRRKPRAM